MAVKLNGLENALGVRIEHIVALEEPTGLDNAAEQIILIGILIAYLAAVILYFLTANGAADSLFSRVIGNSVTVFVAGAINCDTVEETLVDIVILNGHLVLVSRNGDISCGEVKSCKLEHFIVIKLILRGDFVGLFT